MTKGEQITEIVNKIQEAKGDPGLVWKWVELAYKSGQLEEKQRTIDLLFRQYEPKIT